MIDIMSTTKPGIGYFSRASDVF